MKALLFIAGLAAAVVGALLAWWWFIGRNRPKYPPLEIANDDPEMRQAIQNARSTISRLRELHFESLHECQVKVPFRTSSGETENLMAEVLELGEQTAKVRYLSPPVTHVGKVDRLREHALDELVDWAVFRKDGLIEGGFTQRVMFSKARAQWGALPPELEKQASRYVA
jgi:hypothetical protein